MNPLLLKFRKNRKIILILCLLILSAVFTNDWIARFDETTYKFFNGIKFMPSILLEFFQLLGSFYGALLLIAATGLQKRYSLTFRVIAAYILSMFSSIALKNLFERQRPWDLLNGENITKLNESSYAYPSTHSTIAFSIMVVIALNSKNVWVKAGLAILAVSTAITRLILGVHWPTDVIGGALLGSLIGVLVGEYKGGKKKTS